jgi:hypothetical protein
VLRNKLALLMLLDTKGANNVPQHR